MMKDEKCWEGFVRRGLINRWTEGRDKSVERERVEEGGRREEGKG